MSEKRCFGCMQLKQSSPVCEHCGYDERTPNAPHQLPPGTVLNGQYIVGKVLGQGGFGITYMGYDQFLGIPVAIKEYFPGMVVTRNSVVSTQVFLVNAQSSELFVRNRDRFAREARALARLGAEGTVPNIVRVQNLIQANNTAYIIMEYVRGINLRDYIRRQGAPLSLQETLGLLLPVIKALEKVHENHIVHRDLSPDNIMVLPDCSTKLIDFGAAHEVNRDVDGIQSSTEAIVKHGFAPPEQYTRRGNLDSWTDVYAMSATVYYCLTGRVPPSATDRQFDGEEIIWSGIAEQYQKVLEKGMALKAADRIQTMAELRQGLCAGKPASKQEYPMGTIPLEALESAEYRPVKPPVYTAPVEEPPVRPTAPVITAPVETGMDNRKENVFQSSWTISATEPGSGQKAPDHPVPAAHAPAPAEKGNAAEHSPGRRRGLLALAAAVIALAAGLFWFAGSNRQEKPALSQPTGVDPDAWRENVLMPIRNEKERTTQDDFFEPVYGSSVRNDQILSVTFLDTLNGEPADSWDVSHAQNGTVKAWVKSNGKLYDLYIAAEGGINGSAACKELFAGFTALEKIHFGTAFHTETAESMYAMFFGCYCLTDLDLSGFNTANVLDMSFMFSSCSGLSKLDLSSFDTANVTDMGGMFSGCSSLTSLVLNSFDTVNVTDMRSMFSGCSGLTSLDLSGFDTAKVTDMNYMFNYCSSLTALDLSSFDTANITDMSYMFYYCSGLTSLDLSSFDTANVTDMSYMFYYCSGLTSLDLSSFDTAKVRNMGRMFSDCSSLTSLDLSSFDTANVLDISWMFPGCNKLKDVKHSILNRHLP